jgi:hypothetical protein
LFYNDLRKISLQVAKKTPQEINSCGMITKLGIFLVYTTRAAGVRTAGCAGRSALGNGTPVRMGEKKR